jgi:uncharacterized protein (UPF0335 family)
LPAGKAADIFRRPLPVTQAGGAGFSDRTGETGMAKGGVQAERLKSLIERIERLEEERAATAGDIREVYAEAKSAGYDTKVMRQIVKLRKMDSADRQEQQALLDVYMQAVGLG